MQKLVLIFIAFLFCSSTLIAQADEGKLSNIRLQKLTDKIYMLQGKGGNIGLNFGRDKTLMIDDQFANLTEEILEAIHRTSKKPIQYVINTHHHGDHTGGNANMAKKGATIIAHENVRKRLTTGAKAAKEQGTLKATGGLPPITFSESMTLHFEGEPVMIVHVHNAHTDGDAFVYFTESNVIQAGDVLFKNKYPYIDLKSGGSVQGYLDAQQKMLTLTDAETKIIPGHGDLANADDIRNSFNMLTYIYKQVYNMYANGADEAEILASKNITKVFDEKGYGDGFITNDKILKTVYDDVVKERTKGKK